MSLFNESATRSRVLFGRGILSVVTTKSWEEFLDGVLVTPDIVKRLGDEWLELAQMNCVTHDGFRWAICGFFPTMEGVRIVFCDLQDDNGSEEPEKALFISSHVYDEPLVAFLREAGSASDDESAIDEFGGLDTDMNSTEFNNWLRARGAFDRGELSQICGY